MLIPHNAENLKYNNAVQKNILCINKKHIVISGFSREVNETCAFLGYYATYRGGSLPTFRRNVFL